MEDEQIIALFHQRSEDAIAAVKERYDGICMQLLRNLLQNEQDAQECANDTYLALWNTIPPEAPKPLLTYLLKIARNRALRRIRYYHTQRRDHQAVALQELESCLASGHLVEQELEKKLLEAEIERFLRMQKETDRLLFLRRYWFCDSIEVLADTFGWSQSKVKSRLFRLRGRLREHLVKEEILSE